MKLEELEGMAGADLLRLIVSNMNYCREDLNDRFSAEQLFQIGRMLLLSDWDIYPDQWSERQLAEALAGVPPRFDFNTERPVYSDTPAEPDTAGV